MTDRIALASRDLGIRKPLSRGFHAELPAPFDLHDVYREQPDGSRIHCGMLTIKAVRAWQRASGSRRYRPEPEAVGG